MFKVDLNSDLGESFGAYTMGLDSEVIKYVTSANVACGWHAGDPLVMDATLAAAKECGAAVGAHPGYPDLMGFGRRNMVVSPKEAKAYVKYQMGALMAFTKSYGLPLQHVKPHGALYNMAAKDVTLARALAEAIAEVDDTIIMLALANSQMITAAKEVGLRVANEVFADRAYLEDGNLVPRNQEGAVIHDEALAMERVIDMVTKGKVKAITGKEIAMEAHSICVHGDNPKAVDFVRTIREKLQGAGVEVVNLSHIV